MPSLTLAAAGPDSAVALPPIREDLKLYPAPRHRDGAPSWRIQDPVRNAFFEIGWLEFELLTRWHDFREASALIDEISAQTTLAPSVEEVQEMVAFLATNQLLAPSSAQAREMLARKRQAAKHAWYLRLLHNYLFFRLPLVRPDAFLSRTVGWTNIFTTRSFWLVVLVVFGLDLYFLQRDWHSYTASFMQMLTPQGILAYALALSFAKVVHELAHAYSAKRQGVRVPAMGVAFLVMWPFLYTDTAETWKLADRRKQLTIAAAGVLAELVLAIFASLAWALAPEGTFKSVFFVLATSSWIITLGINASPFMRFDGYFVLSDALDFPNLHERGSACARWWLRTTFFRLPEAQPEPMLSVRNRRWLIAFACTTWIYRLVVFLGIALLVYYMFFKLLGIALMVVELWWFIFRPVAAECAEIWRVRDRARPAAGPFIGLFALLGAIIWLVPISSQVGAPGILRAAREQAVYAPFPARLIALEVESGQLVEAGALLARLEAPDIKLRAEQAGVAIVSAQAELARTPASQSQQERRAVLQQELAEALATKQAVQAAIGQQELRAFHAGTVRDLPNDLAVGRWLNPNQLLMHVVSQGDALIEAFVDERQVRAVSAGQSIRFYPSRADLPPLTGTVLAVDKSPIKELSRPVLASVYGGNIAVTQSQNGALLAQDAAYRVTVAPAGVVPQVDEVLGGTVRIETNWHFITENFLYRMLSVLIRESGF